MPTSYEVIFLGQLSIIDSQANNEETAENAGGILGTYGTTGTPLFNNVRTLTAERQTEDDNNSYDVDNFGGYDSFRINGGAPQNFDAVAIYNATITYIDGTTASITAVVFQDVNGRTYLAPELTANADQAALTAAPIRSLQLVSVASNTGDAAGDMAANRIAGDFKAPVDGAETAQTMGVGFADGQNDRVTTGADVVYANGGNDTVVAGGGGDLVYGGTGDDTQHGDDGNDALFGDQGQDWLFGGTGSDTLSGGTENDLIYGGSDNDTVSGDDGNDMVYGDAGNDTGFGGAGSDTLYGGDGNDSLSGGAGNDSLGGDGGDDTLFGGDGSDTMSGGTEGDILFGGADGDTLSGDAGDDSLSGDAGHDTLLGGMGQDRLAGGTEDDTLFGGADADTLWGDAGNDRLVGGSGSDTLTGGAGDDVFGFDRAGGADTVTDFDMSDADGDGRTNDQLDVSALRTLDGRPVTAYDVVVQDAGGGSARLVFPEGESIVLLGVAPSQMTSAAQMFRAGIPCFTPDTLILTPQGQRPVTQLRPGDLVVTRDDGPQRIVW
ncbi:Hemolysin-type calcium-binding repeat-containing protein [Loktanella fryxellensis]|uniref:Hemolysin-type calcium-binding repeat-containing protein n=1 Tax=Loktanella fryxellensis TaxID=245187 RepID=A0A1H8FR09_9RHOB|nr:Hemolysin-type calcium-binding repeat-containing protein [Loktanella fryxellensis]